MELLRVNVGSSSVKLRLIGATGEVLERLIQQRVVEQVDLAHRR